MEDKEERTEEPTGRKLEKEREKGNVAKSQEVNSFAMLLAFALSIFYFGQYFINHMSLAMQNYFRSMGNDLNNMEATKMVITDINERTFIICGPFFAFAFVIALVINYWQVGVIWTTEKLKIDFKKIMPKPQKLKDMIFSAKSLAELLKSVAKVGILGWIAYDSIMDNFLEFKGLKDLLVEFQMPQAFSIIFDILWKLFLVIFFIAVADIIWQKYKYKKDLRMTKKEVKDEFKDMDGNPEIKGKRKSIMRQMFFARIENAVPKADVIVTNPTHISVALTYDPSIHPAPKILAMGKENRALKMREIAKEHDIPIIENKPLARAIFFNAEEGDFIPEDVYVAVAELMVYVFKLKNDPRLKELAA